MVSFLIWKLISWQKEIWLHRGQICVVSQHSCNYTVDQTDSFIFNGFFPPLWCPWSCQDSQQQQFSLAAEQGDGDGWAALTITPRSLFSNLFLNGHIQSRQTQMDPGFRTLAIPWRWMVFVLGILLILLQTLPLVCFQMSANWKG